MNISKWFLCVLSVLMLSACGKDKAFQRTGLPVIYIKTDNGKDIRSKTDYLSANVLIVSDKGETVYASTGEVKGRGNFSWLCAPKKGYTLKLDEKTELFGMAEAKKWVLIANYADPTNIFNTVAFELGRRLKMDFCNHTQHVELVVNGKHLGNYLLTEKIEVKKGRVDINVKQGGFLAELDVHLDEVYNDKTKHYGLPFMIHTPENKATFDRAKALFDNLDAAISKDGFSYDDYAPYVDVESLAKFMIHNELICCLEWNHPKSVFVYSYDRFDKLHFGIPWDYDWAFGDARYYDESRTFSYFEYPTLQTMGRAVSKPVIPGDDEGFNFFNRFFQDPEFCRIYKKVWKSYYKDISSIDDFITKKFMEMRRSNTIDAMLWLPKDKKIDQNQLSSQFRNYMRQRIKAIDERVDAY